MENLTNNPNLSVDIGQKILQPLEDASLQSCRLVNSSMKHMVDKPRFWLQKLEKKGMNPQFKSKTLNENHFVKDNLLNWRKCIDWVENTELEKNALLCLIKMHHQNFQFDPQYQVPIYFTSYVGDASLVKLILGKMDKVAKSTSMQVDDFINTNAFTYPPLFSATWGNHIEVVMLLLNYAKNLYSKRDVVNGCTPIYLSACRNHIEVVKLLINSNENPNEPINDGTTPIFIAAQENHIQMVKLLIDVSNNPNAPKSNGTTPIYIAAELNHIEVVKLLIDVSNNPNAPKDDGATPIFIAAQKNHIEVVKLLMKLTENPNAPRNDGVTPITIASQNNHLEIVLLLANYILHQKDISMES